jgi:hypothetical protein
VIIRRLGEGFSPRPTSTSCIDEDDKELFGLLVKVNALIIFESQAIPIDE